ncbi:MAG TPA: mechanosensitive ion channel domain-containing protein [Bacteroidales bacterium]|nr:mechanosensitive ion channel domain-containing protein [Bacteroidales bacterium]
MFLEAGLGSGLSILLTTLTLLFVVILLSWLSNLIAKAIIRNVVTSIVKKTTSTWDDIFLEQKVFTRLSHLAPAFVIWSMAGWALSSYPTWLIVVHKMTYIYVVIVGTVVVTSFINAWHEIYKTLPISAHRHIKGYVQLVKLIVYIITFLILFAVISKKDITAIVTGLGAMAAVLLLIFKDTILGLVASIQLSANDMIRIGDWITIPGRDVDGTVMDITLNTVKIQNFDKTIITVPTYALVNESFQNWKGMEDSKTRQIKRPILIDMQSIKFMDSDLKKKLSKYQPLSHYMESFEKSRSEYSLNRDDAFFNHGLLTNLGLFRFYAEAWLKQHPLVDKAQTVILRHKQTDGNGLPLQIYLFTKGYQMAAYENLQSEIFEHLIAMLNEFGLKIYQNSAGFIVINPTGSENQNQ